MKFKFTCSHILQECLYAVPVRLGHIRTLQVECVVGNGGWLSGPVGTVQGVLWSH